MRDRDKESFRSRCFSLATLLSKDFLSLVLIAAVIAIPVALLAMNNWLQDFAYRTEMHWWIFAVAESITFLIALMIVSLHTFRAAIFNSIKAVRTE